MTEQAQHHATDPQEDEISLRPYFEIIWRYRKVIGQLTAGVAILFVIGAIGLWAMKPTEKIASIQFRLLFDGASKGQYPNGTPFSASEVVATPVLLAVYEANDLQKYGKYEAFKDALFVQQSNPELDMLDDEYQAKLSDTKLTSVDRARIEAEFKKKRETLQDPVFSLTLRRSERFTNLPADLAEKLLTDTLNTWAKIAAEQKGAVKYNIPTFSRNVFPQDFINSEDYIVAIDIVRSKVDRILKSIDLLAALPGAQIVRVGKDQVALAEVRANLEDIVRFKLQPLVGYIRQTGLSKDQRLLTSYLENQLFQIQLDRKQADGKVAALQNSMRDYIQSRGSLAVGDTKAGGGVAGLTGGTPAMIPQFGESFLDRIVQMTTQNTDVKYRQDLTDRIIEQSITATGYEKEQQYYQDVLQTVRGAPPVAAGSRDAAVAESNKRFAASIDGILKAIDQVNAIYDAISKQNLNPSTMLYTVTAPFSLLTVQALNFKSVGLGFILVIMLTLIVVPAGCLAHNAMTQKKHAA